jgi:prevent-host-death family protein
MKLAISQAKGKLTDLVRRAEIGEEVILTRHGHMVARLVAMQNSPDPVRKREIIEKIVSMTKEKIHGNTNAASSQDFLYGVDGLPE